jgi:hypothetical protein
VPEARRELREFRAGLRLSCESSFETAFKKSSQNRLSRFLLDFLTISTEDKYQALFATGSIYDYNN